MRPFGSLGRTAVSFRRVAAGAALAFLPAWAQAVSVSPVLVDVTPARPVQTVTVANPGDTPMRYQAQVFAWTQRDGADVRTPSDELIVAPAIADIPAGGQQIFRIAARVPAAGAQRAYRLVLEDIGAAPGAGGDVAIHLRVNHDLPVFISPPGLAPARLVLGACATPAPGCVRVRNDGAAYGVVRRVHATVAGASRDQVVNIRLLAGAWREWTLPVAADGGAVRFGVTTDAGELAGPDSAR